MRIAITSQGYSGWAGGIDFLRHILSSLVFAENKLENKHTLFLTVDDERTIVRKDVRSRFDGKDFQHKFGELGDQIELVISGSDLRSQLRKAVAISADVVMPCLAAPDLDLELPWVGYLYDFQHCCLPEFFTPKERASRDVAFYQMLHRAGHVVVNSRAVADDARMFFGDFPAKIHVLPFSPCPQLDWLESDLDIRKQYGIYKPYFMVCNQFWRHKDHGSAFEGFAEFIRNGNDALLVCTGEIKDYRFPGFFSELQELIKDLGMQNRISILGHIPKMHQISLIKHAMAMVQPTRFEGGPGGGAAYDAISLGIPVICSDIPVNMEINSGDVRYFETRNPGHLAQRMVERAGEEMTSISNEYLWQQGIERKRRCGDALVRIARQAVEDFRKDKVVTLAAQGVQVDALTVMNWAPENDRPVQEKAIEKQSRELGRILTLVAEIDQLQAQLGATVEGAANDHRLLAMGLEEKEAELESLYSHDEQMQLQLDQKEAELESLYLWNRQAQAQLQEKEAVIQELNKALEAYRSDLLSPE